MVEGMTITRDEATHGGGYRLRSLDTGRTGGGGPLRPPPPPAAMGAGVADEDLAGAGAGTMDVPVRSLAQLAGVRRSDESGERHRLTRTRPRLAFRPVHALAVILLLVAALCASLTMLIRQSIRYEAALAGTYDTVRLDGPLGGTGGGRPAESGGGDRAGPQERVASRGDRSGVAGNEDAADAGAESGTHEADGPPRGEDGNAAAAEPNPPPADDGLIDLNTATSQELQTINGIGPVTAESILAYRARIGRFASVDQLLDVTGIGPKTLDKLRAQVTVR